MELFVFLPIFILLESIIFYRVCDVAFYQNETKQIKKRWLKVNFVLTIIIVPTIIFIILAVKGLSKLYN